MKQRMAVVALVSVFLLLLASEAAQAQIFVGRGGGRTSVGVYTPGFSFQYGRPYYGGYGWGGYGGGYSPYYSSGWGYSPYYRGWSSGYSPGSWYSSYPSYGSSYPSYGYSYPSTTYYSSPTYTYSNPDGSAGVQGQYDTTQGTSQSSYQSFYPQGQNAPAQVHVVLPDPNARVWIQNTPTQQMGPERLFISPPLEPGHQYTYTIRASWMEDGREVTREKTINVEPGQMALANFMVGAEGRTEQPAASDRQRAGAEQTHEGKIVRAGDGKLIMTDMQGANQHTHDVLGSATIMIDGRAAQLSDLREGQTVRITTKDDATKTVVRIEARSRDNQNQQNQNQQNQNRQNQNQENQNNQNRENNRSNNNDRP